jgi:DNA-binding CsgD family transcriptional regulator
MRTRASRLIGRGAELATLESGLAAAGAGQGRAVFVLGEAGIGKTRLVTQTVGAAVAARAVVLRGRASTVGPSVPFRPLAEALMSLCRRGITPDDPTLEHYRPAMGALVPEWAVGETPPPGGSVLVLAEAILRLSGVVGRATGSLIVLEDLHDADVETLAVVEYLCDNIEGQPTMLLATARPEPGPALDLVHAAARRHAEVLHLGRLDAGQVHELVASCLDARPGEVPPEVSQRLWRDGAGVPFVVEELLYSLVSGGRLARQQDGWRMADTAATGLPSTLTRSIAQRTERLGTQGRDLLRVAAVLGRQFSLTVVQDVLGVDDHSLLRQLQACAEAQLIVPDEQEPDWYTFAHPLTADALRGELTPAERGELARRAADAAQARHPGLPEGWCHLVATLRAQADQPVAAAGLFTEAARRALAAGAAGSAVSCVEQAERLLAGCDDRAALAEVLAVLVYALAENGQFDRALAVADTLDDRIAGAPDGARLAVHARLAWAAHLAGRWSDGSTHIAAARALLRADSAPADRAAVDATEANLALESGGPDGLATAERLAGALVARPDTPPQVRCQGWQVIGRATRERDLVGSTEAFEVMLRVADEHRLAIWRVYARFGLAGNRWLADTDPTGLASARDAAAAAGAIAPALNMVASLAMHLVLTGDYDGAADAIAECLATVERLRMFGVARYLHMTAATLAAHQGDREAMTAALARFRAAGGDASPERPLAHGLAGAFGALLHEDRATALSELDHVAAAQADRPTTFYLGGACGLRPLLDVLDGRLDAAGLAAGTAKAAARMRWNAQFVAWARAVQHGRDGDPVAAERSAARALELAAPYPMARHLALRLVAGPAQEAGWGDPVEWLRAAEEHFHGAGVTAVAGACRSMLRHAGAPVRQRRAGTGRVPTELRALGVTIREYEVFEVLADRLTNKAVAGRMHISARTVEKHVASLISKIGSTDRAELVEFAWSLRRSR